MAPLTQAALSAILLFLGTTSCTPLAAAAAAKAANTFEFRIGNFSTSVPISKCFDPATVTTITDGPGQLRKCIQLGDTYNSFIVDRVGKNLDTNERCFFLTTTDDCSDGDGANVHPLGTAAELGSHCELQGDFTSILYTDDCPSGGGGKM
jgi:hypothetical protein